MCSCAVCQKYAMKLRASEVEEVQHNIEREVGTLLLLREERMLNSSGGRNTASYIQRMNFRRRKIRQLLSVWEAWHLFMEPADSVAPTYSEDNIFAGNLPWQPTDYAQRLSEDAVKLAWFKVLSELQRTEEELGTRQAAGGGGYLRHDAVVLMAYHRHIRHAILRTVLAMGERLTYDVAHLLFSKVTQIDQLLADAKGRFEAAKLLP